MTMLLHQMWLLVTTLSLVTLASSSSVFVVDIGHEDSSVILAEKIAVLACQGLINRDVDGEESVFTVREGWDAEWLDTAMDLDNSLEPVYVSASEFLTDYCALENYPKILYSKETHHEIIPQLITLAGVLDSVPLDTDTNMDELPAWQEQEVALDALEVFPEVSEYLATEYSFDNYGSE